MGNRRKQLVRQEKDNSAKKQKMSDNIHGETMWRKRQAVCYTTHYRGILSVISSFPVDHYGINKGNYVSPDMGQQCDPSTVYPIPTGDLLEYGRTQPEILRGVKVPDDNTPVNDIQMSGKSTRRSKRRTIAVALAQLSKISSSPLHGQMPSTMPGRTRSRRRTQ